MTTLLAAAALLQSNQFADLAEWEVWKTAIGTAQPTGNNGLEEAAAAIYLYDQLGLRDHHRLMPYKELTTQVSPSFAERFAAVIPYMEASLQKPWKHQMDGPDQVMPVFAHLKNLSKGCGIYTRTQFHEGNTGKGADGLLLAFRFARKSGEMDTLISSLVCIAQTAIVFGEYERHLHRFRAADLERLIIELDAQLKFFPMSHGFVGEARFGKMLIDGMLDDRGAMDAAFGTGELPDNLSEEEIRAAGNAIELSALAAADVFENHPEHEWTKRLGDVYQMSRDLPDGARSIIDMMSPVAPMAGMAEARLRTSIRVLRLHAMVRLFELQTGRLPKSLSELARQDAVYDPFANAPFAYSTVHERFSIVSVEGVSGGEIGISFRSNRGGGPPPPVN
jgi:hypothetical protein